ncbi:MAG: hypothetical protein J7K40_14015 [candidate division Zixibacteria bacterium]|nr:hypothetical protein [candidate division Zixibacteria bacterium]
MGLKFDCAKCGKLIIAGFLLPFDELYCPHCENLVTVPGNASETNEPSNVLAIMKEKALIKENRSDSPPMADRGGEKPDSL